MSESNTRRDIELILLGIALGKAERPRVLAAIGDGVLSKEFVGPLKSLRTGDPYELTQWLVTREITLEKGKDVIQAIIDKIVDWNERERLQRICKSLTVSSKVEHTSELKERMIKALKELESMA
jgi:hypothetical protein